MGGINNYDIQELIEENNAVPSAKGKFEDVSDEVLAALREGNHQAYQTVYTLYYKSLHGFVQAMTKSPDDTDDIVQNIFVKIWEKRETLQLRGSMRAYLYVAARNAVIDFFRARRPHDSLFDIPEIAHDRDISGEEAFIAQETQLMIRLAVDNMPTDRRNVFKLSRYDGLTNEQIAKKLKMSPNLVSSHIYNAKKELRELIPILLFFLSAEL